MAFLYFNLFFVFIEEPEFGEMIICIGEDIDLLIVFFSPLSYLLIPHKPLGEVGIHDRVYHQCKMRVLMRNQVA